MFTLPSLTSLVFFFLCEVPCMWCRRYVYTQDTAFIVRNTYYFLLLFNLPGSRWCRMSALCVIEFLGYFRCRIDHIVTVATAPEYLEQSPPFDLWRVSSSTPFPLPLMQDYSHASAYQRSRRSPVNGFEVLRGGRLAQWNGAPAFWYDYFELLHHNVILR